MAGNPIQPLEAATKQYIDNGLTALNADNLISGTVPVARLPALTGDVTSNAGSNVLTLSNTGVTAGIYAKVTVDAKDRVTAGSTLSAIDIPDLDWSKIISGKPTTLSGYGITDRVNKAGDTMTGPLTLSGNAVDPLHAVPLQQLNTIISSGSDIEFITSGDIPSAGLTVGINSDGTVNVISSTGSSESCGSDVVFNSGNTYYISTIYDSINNKVIIAYQNGNNPWYGTAIVYLPSTIITNKDTFIGISQQSATNGQTVKVKLKSSVDSNQSGLTPGQLYYVSHDGTLTTTATDNFLVGKALSDTKLLITN